MWSSAQPPRYASCGRTRHPFGVQICPASLEGTPEAGRRLYFVPPRRVKKAPFHRIFSHFWPKIVYICPIFSLFLTYTAVSPRTSDGPPPCNPAKVEHGHPSPMGTRPSLPDVAPVASDPRPAPVDVGVLPYYIERKNRRPEAGTRGRIRAILLHHQPIKEPRLFVSFCRMFLPLKNIFVFSFYIIR